MKKPAKKMKLRYLVYLALVTTVISSTTLARFVTEIGVGSQVLVAAFASGTTLNLELGTQEAMSPGETRTVSFTVTNQDAGTVSEVPLNYQLQIETTGNLPLQFGLSGEKTDEKDTESRLVGALDEETLCATGGTLPSAGGFGACSHSYTLTISWPEEQNTDEYSYEIDRLSVKISTEQQAKDE